VLGPVHLAHPARPEPLLEHVLAGAAGRRRPPEHLDPGRGEQDGADGDRVRRDQGDDHRRDEPGAERPDPVGVREEQGDRGGSRAARTSGSHAGGVMPGYRFIPTSGTTTAAATTRSPKTVRGGRRHSTPAAARYRATRASQRPYRRPSSAQAPGVTPAGGLARPGR
jgi:hypothetical protein